MNIGLIGEITMIITPKYRVCYENGNAKSGAKMYELHKLCNCENCNSRNKLGSEPVNSATATTKDFSKINEITDFLERWTCKSDVHQPITYFKF